MLTECLRRVLYCTLPRFKAVSDMMSAYSFFACAMVHPSLLTVVKHIYSAFEAVYGCTSCVRAKFGVFKE